MKFTPVQQYQAMHRIEIDLVEYCDMHCHQCNKAVHLAPSTRKINPAQVDRFVAESLDLGYKWQRIHIIGGEPTLHPHFLAIAESLSKYKHYNPSCVLELRTNGGDSFKSVICDLPQCIQVSNSAIYKRNGDDITHHDFYVAPCDHGIDTTDMYCSQVVDCGMSFSTYGYLPCWACTPHVRLFELCTAVQSLALVTPEWWAENLHKYCERCGQLLKTNNRSDIMDTNPWNLNTDRGNISPTWATAFDNYDIHKTDHLENVCSATSLL